MLNFAKSNKRNELKTEGNRIKEPKKNMSNKIDALSDFRKRFPEQYEAYKKEKESKRQCVGNYFSLFFKPRNI